MLIKDFWEETDNNCVLSINGQKVDADKYNILKLFNPTTDKNAVKDFLELLNKMPEINQKTVYEEMKRVTFNGIVKAAIPELQRPQISLINEKEKTVFGIKVGNTSKIDAYKSLRYRLREEVHFNRNSLFQAFPEIGVSLYFSDEELVEEIVITKPFSGTTSKGLRIGDSMEKAVNYHGEPKIRSLVSAFWGDFSVSIKDETVESIKLR